MKLKRELPPNYEAIAKTLNPNENTVFTYGNTLYAPNITDDKQIEDHLWIHEETHEKQQINPQKWWNRYIAEPEFRMDQELEAYGNQYAFVCKKNLNAKIKKGFLERIASDLCSSLYGNLLTQAEAESKIRNRANG